MNNTAEKDIVRNNQKERITIKNTKTEMKNPFDGLVDLTWLRQKSLSLKI